MAGPVRSRSAEPFEPFEPYVVRKCVGGVAFDFLVGDLLPDAYCFWLQPDAHTPPAPYDGGPIAGDAQVHLYAVPRRPG